MVEAVEGGVPMGLHHPTEPQKGLSIGESLVGKLLEAVRQFPIFIERMPGQIVRRDHPLIAELQVFHPLSESLSIPERIIATGVPVQIEMGRFVVEGSLLMEEESPACRLQLGRRKLFAPHLGIQKIDRTGKVDSRGTLILIPGKVILQGGPVRKEKDGNRPARVKSILLLKTGEDPIHLLCHQLCLVPESGMIGYDHIFSGPLLVIPEAPAFQHLISFMENRLGKHLALGTEKCEQQDEQEKPQAERFYTRGMFFAHFFTIPSMVNLRVFAFTF